MTDVLAVRDEYRAMVVPRKRNAEQAKEEIRVVFLQILEDGCCVRAPHITSTGGIEQRFR